MAKTWQRPVITLVTAGLLALAACSGVPDSTGGPGSAGVPDPTGSPVATEVAAAGSGAAATVSALETKVLLSPTAGVDAAEVTGSFEASEGNVVSTNDAGLAEVVFPDTSFLRLGPSSEVTITELGPSQVQRTSLALDIGQTWHNVQKLVAADPVYEVVTPVGVASVRGTVFSITCVEGPSCEFIVLDGEIQIDGTTLLPYQRIVLPDQPEPVLIPIDVLPPWVPENVNRDGGRAGAAVLPDPPLQVASISGKWETTFVVTSTNVEGGEIDNTGAVIWTFGSPRCDPDCVVDLTSANGWTVEATLADGVIRFTRTEEWECVFDDTGKPSGETGTTLREYELAIAEGASNSGNPPLDWAASRLTGTYRETATLDPEFADSECDMQTTDGSSTQLSESDVTLVREK